LRRLTPGSADIAKDRLPDYYAPYSPAIAASSPNVNKRRARGLCEWRRLQSGRDDFHLVPNYRRGRIWDDVEVVPTGYPLPSG